MYFSLAGRSSSCMSALEGMDRTLVGVNPVEAGDEGMVRVDADVLPEAEGDPALRGEEADAAAEG